MRIKNANWRLVLSELAHPDHPLRQMLTKISRAEDPQRRDQLVQRFKEAVSGMRQEKIEQMYRYPGRVGVISAWDMTDYRSENKEATRNLMQRLDRMGYDYYMGKGKYDPDNLPDKRTSPWETSFTVPDIRFEDIIQLGRVFEQDSVIWKGPNQIIGMYYIDEGYAIPTLKMPEAGRTDEEEFFSEFRNTGYTTPFRWDYEIDYNGPLTWNDLTEAGFFEDMEDDPSKVASVVSLIRQRTDRSG
jgi:hypothetical protein